MHTSQHFFHDIDDGSVSKAHGYLSYGEWYINGLAQIKIQLCLFDIILQN